MNDILSNRRIETDDDTAEELAKLYEAGHTKAVPVDTPSSISVDGENRKLSAYQQQTYDKVWSGTVGSSLKELVTSEDFQAASDETKAKMLYSLYDYAGENAKTVLFEDYEPDSFAEGADEIIAAGASAADWAAWYGESSTLEPENGKSGVSDAQKYALLQEKGYSDQIKQAIAGSIMGTDMETGGTELYLTNDEKAVLWQLFTGSKSATGNPYSKSMARKVLEAKEAAKDETEDAAEDSTLPPWMQ